MEPSLALCKQGGHRFDPGHVHQTSEAAGEGFLGPRLQSTLYLDNI
jgi:hypothetical protein